MPLYLASDHHFSHANIIDHCGRPFKDVRTMDRFFITQWNKTVSNKDTVYYLGDLTLGNTNDAREILMKLNGKIKLVPGNHDQWWTKLSRPKQAAFLAEEWIQERENRFEVLPPLHEIRHDKHRIMLCHYPIESWNVKSHGSYHFHGHTHGYKSIKTMKNRLDVSWDNYKRILPIDEAIKIATNHLTITYKTNDDSLRS